MAMTREQLSELLSAYLDGEVNPREKAMAEDALRADPAARRLLEELRQTVAVVSSLPKHSAPPDLATELDVQLERAQLLAGFPDAGTAASSPSVSWRGYLRAAAMLGFVLAGGWWFLSQQQDKRQDRLVDATSHKARDFSDGLAPSPASPSSPKPAPMEAEKLIATGADPVVLVNQSFDPEPIRIRVIARNAAERDALTRKFASQLAEAKTENLAHRGNAAGQKQAVGSFYLEGRPGINFSNTQDKQILVRLPQSDAEGIIDSVVAGTSIPADQFALQVGPAVVRGPENARGMLQVMAGNAQPVTPSHDNLPATAGAAKSHTPSGNLLNTLEQIVGLDTVLANRNNRPGDTRIAMASGEKADDEEALRKDRSRPAASRENDAPEALRDKSTAMPEDNEKKEVSVRRPLVSRKLDALAGRAERSAGTSPESAASPPNSAAAIATSTPNAIAQNSFITIVVEFAIPEPPNPAKNNSSRTRS